MKDLSLKLRFIAIFALILSVNGSADDACGSLHCKCFSYRVTILKNLLIIFFCSFYLKFESLHIFTVSSNYERKIKFFKILLS